MIAKVISFMLSLRQATKNHLHKIRNMQKIRSDRENQIDIDNSLLGNVRLHIAGKKNYVCLKHISLYPRTVITINIYGDGNQFVAENLFISNSLYVVQGQNHPNFGPVTNATLRIGGGTAIESMRYIAFNSGVECNIGKNCMISNDITLWNTDAHPILDPKTENVLNWVKGIYIGDHCWLGEKSSVLKNSIIPEDCIIGYNAVVSGRLQESHAAYAGNPACLVKKGITWDSNGAKHGYITNKRGIE